MTAISATAISGPLGKANATRFLDRLLQPQEPRSRYRSLCQPAIRERETPWRQNRQRIGRPVRLARDQFHDRVRHGGVKRYAPARTPQTACAKSTLQSGSPATIRDFGRARIARRNCCALDNAVTYRMSRRHRRRGRSAGSLVRHWPRGNRVNAGTPPRSDAKRRPSLAPLRAHGIEPATT